MENQVEVMEIFAGASNEEGIVSGSRQTDEALGTNIGGPVAIPGIPLVNTFSLPTSAHLINTQVVVEVCDTQSVLNTDITNEIGNQGNTQEKLITHIEKDTEDLCGTNTDGEEDSEKDNLEINSNEDTIPLEEAIGCHKGSCLIDHVYEDTPPEILPSDSEPSSNIQPEELLGKNVAKVHDILHKNSPTSGILSYAQAVPEIYLSELVFRADTANEIGNEEKTPEKMITYQEKRAENVCSTNKDGKEDVEKGDTCPLPAMSAIAVGNHLSPVPVPEDIVGKNPDPMLEINSNEDTIPLEEDISSNIDKRIDLRDLMCEGPPTEFIPGDSISLSSIEAEELCEKTLAKAHEIQHAVISETEIIQVPAETCDVTPAQEDGGLGELSDLSHSENMNGSSVDVKQMADKSEKREEVEPAVFTALKEPDDSPSENAVDLCEGVQEEQVLKRIALLQKQVEHSLDLYSKRLSEDFLCVQKFFEELNQRDTLLLEMSSQADNLKAIIDSVLQLPESSKSDVLDLLEACFRSGHWLEKSVKTKELADCKQLMSKGYAFLRYDGISKVKAIINQHLSGRLQSSVEDITQPRTENTLCDPYLVTVTYVADPGEFYVVRLCDSGKLDAILTALNKNAASYPMPIETIPGQMYAVCNSALNWFRGVCGKECGRRQVGDQPSEILYEFFMIDQGHHEHIPASSVRLLPSDLLNFPAVARECTLNQNFHGTIWNIQTINLFKHMTRKSPMNMKVFKQHGGVLEVDLAQLISFGEGANIVSVRDALFFSHRPISTTPSRRKFTPKFLVPKVDELKHFAVTFSSAENPANIYVQVLDEELGRYRLMHDELQVAMANITVNATSNYQHLEKGFICAVMYLGHWYRCLVEDIHQHNRVLVFYVDTGHRQTVHGSECLNLPETFLELPSQAVCCVLDGINPLNTRTPRMNLGHRRHNVWSRDVVEVIRGYRSKQGIIIVENWKSGEVGRLGGELKASVILYRDGDQFCLNATLARAGLVKTTKEHWYPEHAAIRSSLSVQRKISQSTSIDSLGSGTAAASTDASQTTVERSSLTTHELIAQAPSAACGQDDDLKNFDCKSESNHTDPLPFSILQVSSDNHTSVSEIADPGNPLQVYACSTDSVSLVDEISGNTVESISESSNFISNPGDSYEVAVGIPLLSKLKDCLLENPMGGSASEDNSAISEENHTLKAPLDDSSSCVTLSSSGLNVSSSAADQQKEKVVTNATNIIRGSCSKADSDIVGIVGTQPEYETSITVSYVWMDSPDAIYFRTADMKAQYEEIRYKMRHHYQNKKQKEKITFEVGFRCAVYEDRSFWRAEVVCMDDYPKCKVLFVDTGYQRRVRANNIYALEPIFDEIKRLILKCSLFGVFCGTTNGVWKEDCTKYVHDRLLGAENISIFRRGHGESKYAALPVMCIYIYNVEGGPFQIPGRTQINLNDELVSMGLAQNRPGLVPLPNPIPVTRTWKQSQPPKVESAFWAKVTWVSLAGEIYLYDVKSDPALMEITKWLYEAYNGTEPTEADLRCRSGDLCIARYELDQQWYRAIVKENDDDPQKIKVFFVDYGTLDAVDRRDIRLKIMLEELPTLTICCKLFNVRPNVGDRTDGKREWPIETLNHLHELIVEQEFRVLVKGSGPPMPVVLITNKQSSIASYLVQKKMAEFIDLNLKKNKRKKKKWEKK